MEKTTDTRKETIQRLLLRLELWFAPVLIIVPILVSLVFVAEWYTKGFTAGNTMYDGELRIGLLILIGNLLIDVPFLRSIRTLRKKRFRIFGEH